MFTKHLKDRASLNDDPRGRGYCIIRYPHPDSGKQPEFVRTVQGLAKAQAICNAPEASFKEGPTSGWWFLGYANAGSRSWHITPW